MPNPNKRESELIKKLAKKDNEKLIHFYHNERNVWIWILETYFSKINVIYANQ